MFKNILLILVSLCFVLSCETDVPTKIKIPVSEKAPFLQLAVHGDVVTGEVRRASTNFEYGESTGIPNLEVNIESSEGTIQSYVSDSDGLINGSIVIHEAEKYRLGFRFENRTFYSQWIEPLPVSDIQTRIDTVYKEGTYFFSKLQSSLQTADVAIGVRSFLEGQITDSLQIRGLALNNIIKVGDGAIKYPGMELSFLQDIDSVELFVHYYDREFTKFRSSLKQNNFAEIYSSFEPSYSNIGEENGLFCFYFTDTL